MIRLKNNSASLRAIAEEARVFAENAKHPQCRLYMLSAARTYERLAEMVEEMQLMRNVSRPADDDES